MTIARDEKIASYKRRVAAADARRNASLADFTMRPADTARVIDKAHEARREVERCRSVMENWPLPRRFGRGVV